MHGSVTVQTTVADLAAANHTVYGFRGTVNMATGKLAVVAHALTNLPEPALTT